MESKKIITKEQLTKNIAAVMKRRNVKTKWLVEQTGIPMSTLHRKVSITNMEAGATRPVAAIELYLICKALRVSMYFVMDPKMVKKAQFSQIKPFERKK